MRRSSTRWLSVTGVTTVAFGFTVALALTASAEPGEAPRASTAAKPVEVARFRYRQGVEAYGAGRYREAIDHFLEADSLAPSAVLSFNIARAYERTNDTAAALRWYRDYLKRDPAAKDRAGVETSIKGLEQRLAEQGVQQVTIVSDPPGAAVAVDGQAVGTTPWTSEIRPGSHAIVVRLSGYEEASSTFELTADHAMDVGVTLKPAQAAPASEAAPAPAAPEAPKASKEASPPKKGFPLTTLGWIGIGVGGAALGGALAFEVLRRSAESDAEKERTQIRYADRLDAMHDRQAMAQVLAVTGVAFGVTGGVLLLLGHGKSRPEQPNVGLACLPGACLSSVRGRF